MDVQITHISIKPVLHYEQFNLYNEFVTNVIAVGSYHLDGNLMRVFFGESDSLLKQMQPDVWAIPQPPAMTVTLSAAYARLENT